MRAIALALSSAVPGWTTAAPVAWDCTQDRDGTWQCRAPDRPDSGTGPTAAEATSKPKRETEPAPEPGTTQEPSSEVPSEPLPARAVPAGAASTAQANTDTDTDAEATPDRAAESAAEPPLQAMAAQPPRGAPRSGFECAPPPIPGREDLGADLAPGETRIRADQSGGTERHFVLTGNVEIERLGERLQADRVTYDQDANRADAEGNVVLQQPGFEVRAQSGYTEIEGEQGEFNQAHYELPERNARGDALHVEKVSDTEARLKQASYTTCPNLRRDWELRGERVELDKTAGTGTARNVTVRFKDVPFFYTPWISFPIDDQRKSGFLLPNIGTSGESGFDLSVPYYWNIAPNRDATITPRILTDRGVQLQGEYRYLTRRSYGETGLEYLPDDDVYGDDRALFSYREHSTFTPNWSTDVNLNWASDPDYFHDLGQTLSIASVTHLERRADLNYASNYWSVLGRLQGFQPMRGAGEGYRRMPQVIAQATIPGDNPRWMYQWYGEAVYFDHALDGSVPTGARVDLKPGISYDLRGTAWYVRPQLSARYTGYTLDNNPAATSPERTTPILSVDSGLFFERDATVGGRSYLHTLEPRAYYLYVPYENQDDIPLFDTGLLDFSFAQLFRDNRFSGPDRQGDANQLTLAVTSRLLENESGAERLRASIGQIYYFDDREVTLTPSSPTQDQSSSAIVGELGVTLWRATSLTLGAQYDPHTAELDKSAAQLRYQPAAGKIFNVGYRFRRNDLEQTDVSFLWPLSARWSVVGRWNYSLRDELTLERFAGLQYDSCCWAVRMVARQYVNDLDSDTNTAFYIQFVLKGLTNIGTGVEDLLQEGIIGYDRGGPLQ